MANQRPKDLRRKRGWNVTKGRWLVVVGLSLIMLGTAGVLLYARGVQEEPGTSALVSVVVFDVDIPAGTDLDQVIKNDQLEVVQVPSDVVVDGT